jgi:hypothetical protein
MNCAERLVALFGSQAEVARRFRIDRAVVSNWVKTGYVPSRWAVEVEQATAGQISAVEVLSEANACKPIKLKSRGEEDSLFGPALVGANSMNPFAPARRIQSFHPPQRTLMGPGPSEINPRVMAAMGLPAIGYLDPIFVEMMEELKTLLRYTFQTKNPLTFPVSGPGSVGMEYCFVNLVAPGDKVVVCRNGVFGGRMIENVERCGGIPIIVEDGWGEPVDPNKLDDALKAHPDTRIVAFVHAETLRACSPMRRHWSTSRTATAHSRSWTRLRRSRGVPCSWTSGGSTRSTLRAKSACRAHRASRRCPSARAWWTT